MNLRYPVLAALGLALAFGSLTAITAAEEPSPAQTPEASLREVLHDLIEGRLPKDERDDPSSSIQAQRRLEAQEADKFRRLVEYVKKRANGSELEVGRVRKHRIALMGSNFQLESEGLFLPEAAFLLEFDGSIHPRVWYGDHYISLGSRKAQARLREELAFWMRYSSSPFDPPGPIPPPAPLP